MYNPPPAYVTGSVEFYNLKIEVNSSTLIPRLESELLVEHALKRISKKEAIVLDLCCGSGALGLALKGARRDLHLILADISPDCVAMTKKNAKSNGLAVEVREGNLLEVLKEGEEIDFMICNPPYVTTSEYETLDPSVRLFEPKLALVGGDDGLFFYREIEKRLSTVLRKGGKAFFEIGKDLGEGIKKIFNNPLWCDQELLQDYASLDRFFIVARSEITL
ncbi:MAG: peptide chain release factor N(5)-glutamine methyltransferase [Verrucomicrobia bacterium]|nr:peptide chain release factor N(5)-glutamine methyltransferase [Verrucomicrobiota bacterium]